MSPADGPHDTGIRPEDLADGRPRPFRAAWGKYALYPLGPPGDPAARVQAAACFCPHLQGPLFEGSVADGAITCPWHLWTYSLEDGHCVHSPDDEGATTRLERLEVHLGQNGTYLVEPPGE